MRVNYNKNALHSNYIDVRYLLRGDKQLFLVGDLANTDDWEMTDNPDRKLVVGVLFNKENLEQYYCYEIVIDFSEKDYIKEEITPLFKYYLSEGFGEWVTVINNGKNIEVMQSTGESYIHQRITDKVKVV